MTCLLNMLPQPTRHPSSRSRSLVFLTEYVESLEYLFKCILYSDMKEYRRFGILLKYLTCVLHSACNSTSMFFQTWLSSTFCWTFQGICWKRAQKLMVGVDDGLCWMKKLARLVYIYGLHISCLSVLDGYKFMIMLWSLWE